jgi:hypothetical protein
MTSRRPDPRELAPVDAAPVASGPVPTVAPPPPQAGLPALQQRLGNHRVGLLLRDRVGPPTDADPEQLEARIKARAGQGHGLDDTVRRRMEGAMGADFSRVRVHTDGEADALSHALGARAFATGPDIYFRAGEYAPGSSAGRELLAHELTHVVQSGAGVRAKLTVSEPTDEAEREADAVAHAVMQAEHAGQPAARQPTPGAAAPGQVFGFWQELKEAGGSLVGIPVELPAKPFDGDVGKAPEVQKVVGDANSSYELTYDDETTPAHGEFWPHAPPGEMPAKKVVVERGRAGVIRIAIGTWWRTQGGAYLEGRSDAVVEAHFDCDDGGVITIKDAAAYLPSGGGSIVTPVAQPPSVIGPSLGATAGVQHALASTQTGTQGQDRSSSHSNSGGSEVSGGVKAGADGKVVSGGIELGGKSSYSEGNERRTGEQRSTSNSLQQSGLEGVLFTRRVALVAAPEVLPEGKIEDFGINQANVPAGGITQVGQWWDGLAHNRVVRDGLQNGSIGIDLSGHADDTGRPQHNLTLSGQRAAAVQAVFEAVVGKGVVTRIHKLGSAMAAGQHRSNRLERRVDFKLYRVKK